MANQVAYDVPAGPRRLRLHARLRRRAPHARRPHHQHLRGHHPAAGGGGHRRRARRHARRPARRVRRRDYSATPELLARVRHARARLDEAVARVREAGDERFRDYHARRLVEMAIDVVCGYLMLPARSTTHASCWWRGTSARAWSRASRVRPLKSWAAIRSCWTPSPPLPAIDRRRGADDRLAAGCAGRRRVAPLQPLTCRHSV